VRSSVSKVWGQSEAKELLGITASPALQDPGTAHIYHLNAVPASETTLLRSYGAPGSYGSTRDIAPKEKGYVLVYIRHLLESDFGNCLEVYMRKDIYVCNAITWTCTQNFLERLNLPW